MTEEIAAVMPDPESRARGPIDGPSFTAGAFQWQLPWVILATAFDRYRDEIYDRMLLKRLTMDKIVEPAWFLISMGYEVSNPEISAIIEAADQMSLTNAVCLSLLGPPESERTYSVWLRGGFIANGINMASLRPGEIGSIVAHLEASKRLVPVGEWLPVAMHLRKLQSLGAAP